MKNILLLAAAGIGGYFLWQKYNSPTAYPYNRGPALKTGTIYSDYEIQQFTPLEFRDSAWSDVLVDSGDLLGTSTIPEGISPTKEPEKTWPVMNPWLYDPKK